MSLRFITNLIIQYISIVHFIFQMASFPYYDPFMDFSQFPQEEEANFNEEESYDEIPENIENLNAHPPAMVPMIPSQFTLPPMTESDETDTEPTIATNEDHCITITDVKNLKPVLYTKTFYDESMHISKWLTQYTGLIILPLDAISLIRKPTGKHLKNPNVIVYIQDGPNSSEYEDLNEAVRLIYSK